MRYGLADSAVGYPRGAWYFDECSRFLNRFACVANVCGDRGAF